MKIAECSTYDRVRLTLDIVDFINKAIESGGHSLGMTSDVVLYECAHDMLNRIDIYPTKFDD